MAGSGSQLMGIFTHQISQGIAEHRKNVERSRGMLQSMLPISEPDLLNIWNTAQLLADSNPAAEQTWKVELAIFKAIANVHWQQWDHNNHAKNRVDLGSFIKNSMARLQIWQFLYVARLYSTMAHTIGAVYHDSISKETVAPLHFYIKGTYPSLALATTGAEAEKKSDKMYRMRIQDILFHFRLVQNASLTVSQRYYSKQYVAEVFASAGLTASSYDAMALLNTIGFKGTNGRTLTGQGIAHASLGTDLHTVHNVDLGNGVNRQTLIVALIAAYASFQGNFGWSWFNRILIQGAWPWLGGYSKSYAKTVFAAMVCLFCCVRHGHAWSGVGDLILRLARKLVDPNCFGAGRVRVRAGGRLAGGKVLYEPVPKAKEDKKKGEKKEGHEKENAESSDEKVSHAFFTGIRA